MAASGAGAIGVRDSVDQYRAMDGFASRLFRNVLRSKKPRSGKVSSRALPGAVE